MTDKSSDGKHEAVLIGKKYSINMQGALNLLSFLLFIYFAICNDIEINTEAAETKLFLSFFTSAEHTVLY